MKKCCVGWTTASHCGTLGDASRFGLERIICRIQPELWHIWDESSYHCCAIIAVGSFDIKQMASYRHASRASSSNLNGAKSFYLTGDLGLIDRESIFA